MTPEERIRNYRECSNVRRCHTLPHFGEYTVGKHSFDAALLLITLFPDVRADVIKQLLVHDFAERWVGDAPAPAKWFCPDYGETYSELEETVAIRKNLPEFVLTEEEEYILQIIDKLEFWCWCKDQFELGNTNVRHAIKLVEDSLLRMDLPTHVREFLQQYDASRSSEEP